MIYNSKRWVQIGALREAISNSIDSGRLDEPSQHHYFVAWNGCGRPFAAPLPTDFALAVCRVQGHFRDRV